MPALSNTKHEQFANAVAKGVSATEAYVSVGYSGQGAAASASRLLKDAKVRERIEELKGAITAKIVEETGIDKAWVMRCLVENVGRCMQTEPVKDKLGRPVTTLVEGPEGELEVRQMVTYKPKEANQALELIGKELGMFVHRMGGPNGEPLAPAAVDYSALSDDELRQARTLLSKAVKK